MQYLAHIAPLCELQKVAPRRYSLVIEYMIWKWCDLCCLTPLSKAQPYLGNQFSIINIASKCKSTLYTRFCFLHIESSYTASASIIYAIKHVEFYHWWISKRIKQHLHSFLSPQQNKRIKCHNNYSAPTIIIHLLFWEKSPPDWVNK